MIFLQYFVIAVRDNSISMIESCVYQSILIAEPVPHRGTDRFHMKLLLVNIFTEGSYRDISGFVRVINMALKDLFYLSVRQLACCKLPEATVIVFQWVVSRSAVL